MKFLHEQGYTYFDMNKLTVAEINALVLAHNEESAEAERQARLAQRKRR